MKWIGQHIVDLIARFRGDVYLEDVDAGTIASGGNLGLDSNNKIVKATSTSHDQVTLAGTPDYITISGQEITRNAVDLAADVTGVLPSANMDADTAHLSAGQTFTGANVFGGQVTVNSTVAPKVFIDDNCAIDPTVGGAAIHVDAFDVTDGITSASATTAAFNHVLIEAPRLLATNASVTTTNASTLYIKGPPIASTNQTITNAYSLLVDSGDVKIDEDLYLAGTLRLDSTSLSAVQTSSESFSDDNTSLMTSAAIDDKINTKYSTSYITFSAKSTSSFGTNYVMIHANGISESTFSVDSGVDSATDFGGVTTEEGGSGTDATVALASGNLEQQIPIPETCKLIGFYATTSTSTNTGAGYDTGVGIWHVPEANVDWGGSNNCTATLIHKSDSSRHSENTSHSGANRKKPQMVKRMDGTAKTLAAGDIIVPSIFGETSNQQIMATITLVIATPIKTI